MSIDVLCARARNLAEREPTQDVQHIHAGFMPHCGTRKYCVDGMNKKAGRLRDRPIRSNADGCLPAAAAAPAPMATTATVAAAPAPVTATAAPAPVTAGAARTPAPVLHLLDRVRRVRGIANRGAVDRSGRHAGAAHESDTRGD